MNLSLDYVFTNDKGTGSDLNLGKEFTTLVWFLFFALIFGLPSIAMLFIEWYKKRKLPFSLGILLLAKVILVGLIIIMILI